MTPHPPVWLKSCISPRRLWAGILLVGFGLASSLLGAPVSSETAAGVVRGWLRLERAPLGEPLSGALGQIKTFKDNDGQTLYHVVPLSPTGFVIIAGEDAVEPIICFSATGDFDPSTNNTLGALVSCDLPHRVRAVRKAKTLARPAALAQSKWQLLAQADSGVVLQPQLLVAVSDIRVAPLLQSAWDQLTAAGANSTACFNYYTPPNAAGNVNNYPAGCVATAMAQLMRYYQQPTVGVGAGSFTITNGGSPQTYQLKGGDGAGGAYNWANMPLVLPSAPPTAQCVAIGALLADAGATVKMTYTANGSSSVLLDACGALTGTFHYANAIRGFNNNNDLGTNLLAMINPNLDAHYPVLLGIAGSSGGHAGVADGYGYSGSTIYHHLNLGWSGNSTAWYNLPTIDSDLYQFNTVGQCAYNVFTNGTGEIISGRVLDQLSRPVTNATVTATRTGGGTYTAATDSRGIYALARIPSGSTYSITVSKANYASASGNITTGTSQNNRSASGNYWGANFTLNLLATVVDHFTWSAIGSNQAAGTPFAVTLTAQNAANGTVTGFAGTVALSGGVTGLTSTNTLIGSAGANSWTSGSADMTLGYAFTPSTNLQVFAVRAYVGDKVSIWTDDGTFVASQTVSGANQTWVENAMSSPVSLSAGTTYRVAIHVAASVRVYLKNSGWPGSFANGTIGQTCYTTYSDAFPMNIYGTALGPLVDLRYAVVYSNSIAVSPATSGSFSAGVWSGSLSVAQAGGNLVLRADDGAGHIGVSGPLNVTNPVGTLPNITSQPQSVTTNTGDSAAFSLAAFGSPAPAYFWRRNGTAIGGANAASYTLNNVQLPDSGSQFTCVVSNNAGAVTSYVATLTVVCTNVVVAGPLNVTLGASGYAPSVNAVAPLPDGAMIIGGYFTSVNGSTRYCLARFQPDGTLDPNWNPMAYNEVVALAVSGTNLYVGGYFASIGGQARNGLALVSASGTGTVDANWNPSPIGPNSYVGALAVSGTNVYAGGYFTNIGGLARNSIACLGAAGSGAAIASWNPSATYSASAGYVDAILVNNTNVYVGGYFDTLGGSSRNCLGRLSLGGAGAADPSWNPNVLGEVLALAASGTNLYAGGAFVTVNTNVSRPHIARFNTGSSVVDASWNPGADYEVKALAAMGTRVFAGGAFTNIGGLFRPNLAKLNAAGTGAADSTWEADPNGTVWSLAFGNTNLIVAGSFTQIGGQPRSELASLAFAPFKLRVVGRSGGQFQLAATSERGLGFEILASTNLSAWTSVLTLTNSAGSTNYTDPVTTLPRRYYRARQLP